LSLHVPLQRRAAQDQFQDLIEGLELQERSAERKTAEQGALREKEELHKVRRQAENTSCVTVM